MSDVEQWKHDEQRAMENEIISLREQVEKLTAERDAWKIDAIHGGNAAYLREELAVLAEQNEKMRSFFEFAWKDIPMSEYAFEILEHVMNLPNLATPVLNKIKAEAYREAADIVENIDVYIFVHGGSSYDDGGITLSSAATAIRAKADELEQIK